MPGPFFGPISASKAALEALSHAQRLELRHWGIPVVIVEPGATGTEIFAKAAAAARKVSAAQSPELAALYAEQLAAVEKALGVMRMGPPECVAEVIVGVLTAARPRPLYTVGRDTTAIGLLSLVPLRTRDRLLMRVTGLAKVRPARGLPARSAAGGSAEPDRERLQAADQAGVAPAQPRRRDRQGQVGEAGQQRADGDLALQPGERRAEAVVDAMAEGEVPAGVPAQVQPVRVRRTGRSPGSPSSSRGSPTRRPG